LPTKEDVITTVPVLLTVEVGTGRKEELGPNVEVRSSHAGTEILKV